MQLLCAFFLTIWKERNRRAFEKEFSKQRLKSSFLCNVFSWTKLYMDEGPMFSINFVDWLGFH